VSSFENTKNSLLIWIFGFLVLVSGCATTYNPKQNSFEVVLIDENTDIPYTLTTNFNFNFKEDIPGRQGIASDELLFPLNKNNLYYGYLFINSDKPNEESIIGYWKQDTTIFELDASHLYDLNRKKFAYTPTGDEVGIYNAEKKTWCGTVAKYNGDFVLALDKHCLGLVVDERTLEKIQPVTKLYEHRSNQELRKLLTQECQMRRILLDNYPKSSESLPSYCEQIERSNREEFFNTQERLLLFSESNNFHGCLNCSKYETDSICSKYGNYGSRYSNDSIWNKYGVGSKYNYDSPFNRYGQGLKIVDEEGGYYGYFSISYNANSEVRKYLSELWERSNGDYSQMRDSFCEKY